MWIFGYGSLVWKQGFPYVESAPARLPGYRRVFWQGSPDHRGTPAAPGRVVTLVADEGGYCVGCIFRLHPSEVDGVMAQLEIREQKGYLLAPLQVERLDATGGNVQAHVYLAQPDNPHFLGPAPMVDMAAHIRQSQGPSGHNREYVVRLRDALEAMGHLDRPTADLAWLVE